MQERGEGSDLVDTTPDPGPGEEPAGSIETTPGFGDRRDHLRSRDLQTTEITSPPVTVKWGRAVPAFFSEPRTERTPPDQGGG